MKLFNIKKGSEKPIEIFVALFVVLAVAMVLLKMFSGGVSEQEGQLKAVQEQENAKQACSSACSKAKSNDCRIEDQIEFCTTYFKLDLNGNKLEDEDDNKARILCEDRIYCPLEDECTCGVKLDMNQCLELTKNHYNKLIGAGQLTADVAQTKYTEAFDYSGGACVDSSDPLAWPNLYKFDDKLSQITA